MDNAKKCTKCGEIKALSGYYKDDRRKDGHAAECKICKNKAGKQWRRDHKEQLRFLVGRWYKNNVNEDMRAKARASIKLWRATHRERYKEYGKKWNKENPDKVRAIKMRTTLKKRATARGKLHDSLRASIRHSLRQGAKNGRLWESLVGYTVEQLKKHLEKRFVDGMTWDNYGKWHIDHIIPIKVFNYEVPEDLDFKKCWALVNLRPLWAKDNISKSNKLERPFQPSLSIAA